MNEELDSDELLKILQSVESDSEYDVFVETDEPEESILTFHFEKHGEKHYKYNEKFCRL